MCKLANYKQIINSRMLKQIQNTKKKNITLCKQQLFWSDFVD
jgi:hypothetical protein